MKKGIFVLIFCLFAINVFAQQEAIEKSDYRDIGDIDDLEWEIDEISLEQGEKITWTSSSASQEGHSVRDLSIGQELTISVDKNWRIKHGTNYRFFGIVGGVGIWSSGIPYLRIILTHVEEIPIQRGR